MQDFHLLAYKISTKKTPKGISNIFDLLLQLPKMYISSNIVLLKDLSFRKPALCLLAILTKAKFGCKYLISACDSSGTAKFTLFTDYLTGQKIALGSFIYIYGVVLRSNSRHFAIAVKHFFFTMPKCSYYPVYKKSISDCFDMHRLASDLLHHPLDELLPPHFTKGLTLTQALYQLHFPEEKHQQQKSLRRVRLEECIAFVLQHDSYSAPLKSANQLVIDQTIHRRFITKLPFELTVTQSTAIKEIFHDLASGGKAMCRLICGDVASGKTVVLCSALLQAWANDHPSVLMVPSGALALQHYNFLQKNIAPLGVKVVLYTSATSNKLDLAQILKVDKCIVVCTTAVLHAKSIKNSPLLLIVIDEQHLFGVKDRNNLKHANFTHILLASATPNPRTMAISKLNLDISYLDKFHDSKNIRTFLINDSKKHLIIKSLQKAVAAKQQIYYICANKLQGKSLSVVQAAKILSSYLLCTIETLHSASKNKAEILNNFHNGKIDILVATTIVAVGIDNPNANVMIIDDPKSLGIAQLHQLRGRIGRGGDKATLIIFTNPNLPEQTLSRLLLLRGSTDGKQLASSDAQSRGFGNILGIAQSGRGKLKITPYSYIPTIVNEVLSGAEQLKAECSTEQIKQLVSRWAAKQG